MAVQRNQREPNEFVPLTPSVFTILMVLSDADAHGYGIKKDVEQRSEGRIRLEPGTLYRVIGKLLDDGLIDEARRKLQPNEDERRRYYRLTQLGRQVLVAEAERLAVLIDSARAKRLIKQVGSS
jgi:DNA-binding PadR family transcriptional regulator